MLPTDATPFDVPLAVVDLETTGLNAATGDRVCELAVLRAEPDGRQTMLHALVDPCRPISPGASAVNGIRDSDVEGRPRFEELADAVIEALGGAALVAHNMPFDLSFLRAELVGCGRAAPANPLIDTLTLARTHFSFASNRLESVARYLGVPVERAHRADADARTTLSILRRMRDPLESRGVRSLADYVRASGTLAHGRDRNRYRAPVPEPIEAALTGGGHVEIRYRAGSRGSGWRPVQPVRIQGGYLIAICLIRREERMFKLDRIAEVRTHGGT